MRRALSIILIVGLLALGGGFIAQTAYQAGLTTAVTTVQVQAAADGAVVAPLVVPGYGGYPYGGYGWHGGFGQGFGIFGFLGFLFFAFLFFGLIRALSFRGGGGRWGGPNGKAGTHPWEPRARQAFDDWHRTAHEDRPPEPKTAD